MRAAMNRLDQAFDLLRSNKPREAEALLTDAAREAADRFGADSAEHAAALAEIVGQENALSDLFERLRVGYGKTMIDLMRLRDGVIENIPDLVLRPRSREDLRATTDYCDQHAIPVYVYGGGSSVTRGFEATKGGVTLDLGAHLKRVVRFDEQNQTITVEGGMSGPELERPIFFQHVP